MSPRKSARFDAPRARRRQARPLLFALRPLAPLALLALLAAPALAAPPAGTPVAGTRAVPVRSAVVNFRELARLEALRGGLRPAVRPLVQRELEEPGEPQGNVTGPPPLAAMLKPAPQPLVASPSPSSSFMGLDDIPMVDSSFIVIPPDVEGAVGRTEILEGLNNNYRILDKATGATVATVGTATFWAATGAPLNQLTDPRTLYDPYNDRWIVEMQTVVSSGDILVGVSQTSDPGGNWFLYRFNTAAPIDFPIMGFNRDWIVVNINQFGTGGTFAHGLTLVVNYPLARTGTGTGTFFSQANHTHFCSAPCVTYSTTSDTDYVVTHLSSGSATYELDAITGTASAPVYTAGGSQVRPGGSWVQPGNNQLPQSAPVSGTSACGATPCPIESQDSQIRSAPVFRSGSIWYTQSVGLPSTGLTHIGVQWTRLTTPGGAVVDGGRLEDPTATATNGGKWYSHPHVAVNANGDFLVGFTQFSSAQHPGTGYAVHMAADGAGTLRDPLITHAGEDYYHKTFSTTTGRNRWGDFSTAQVDPVDDATLWAVDEYAKARVSTDDGNTGSNGSRWSTWWAAVAGTPPLPVATLAPGPSLAEGNSGVTPFRFTVNLSAASATPVTVNFHTSDGTATAAGNDYQPLIATKTIAAGLTSDTLTVNVVGDTLCEADETFGVTLTGATGATIGAPATATATILNDDARTVFASAGTGGSISPSGAVAVACFASQGFTITPGAGYHVADVRVDGGSVGAVTSFAFNNVTANHTIAASFALNQFTLALSATGTGGVAANPSQASYDSGTVVQLTATPGAGFKFIVWSGSASGSANPLSVTMNANKAIAAAFADTAAPAVTVLAPNGGENLVQGAHSTLQWSALDNRVVARVDLKLSRAGSAGPFDSLAADVPNTGSFDWVVTGPNTSDAFLQVTARDSAGNAASDTSNAAFTISGTTGVGDGPVTALQLAPVSPNPLRHAGVVAFALPQRAHVRVSVHDVLGREAAVLVDGDLDPGRYHVTWLGDGAGAAGLYFVRLTTGRHTLVRRVVVIR